MSTGRFLEGTRPACKAGNLTAISEPIAQTLWDPGHLKTLHGLLRG
jgi:hypothetical protein